MINNIVKYPGKIILQVYKFFPFFDPKADSKIVKLDLLRVAMVLYLSL